jgi:hypothetical protein
MKKILNPGGALILIQFQRNDKIIQLSSIKIDRFRFYEIMKLR